jgi:hypothetical protein
LKHSNRFVGYCKAEKREYLDWLLRDEAAQGIMKGACKNSQLPYVKNCKSAKDMWDTLKKVHVTNQSRINVHYFFEDLYTRKYVDGTPMANHIASMLDIKQQIIDAGETLEDLHVACAMVLSLPKTQSWDIMKIQLITWATRLGIVLDVKRIRRRQVAHNPPILPSVISMILALMKSAKYT